MKTPSHRLVCLLLVAVVLSACVAPLAAQEKSVKPGINEVYVKQPLDAHIKSLEHEQRAAIQHCDRLLASCQLKPGMTVADIGAGTGFFVRKMAAKVLPGGKVYAVDITKSFIDHIAKTCREQKIDNVATVLCTDTSTELPADSVDLIFICDTYHHFEFPQKTLASIRQALRADGKLVIVDYHKAGNMVDHVRGDKRLTIEEISAAGFRLVAEEDKIADQYFLRFEKGPPASTLLYEIAGDNGNAPVAAVLAVLERRLNAGKTKSAKITQIGPRRIQVGLHDGSAGSIRRADSRITHLGALEFQFLAHPEVNKREIALAAKLAKDQALLEEDGKTIARWAPVAEGIGPALANAPTRKIDQPGGKTCTQALVMHDPAAPSSKHVMGCRPTKDAQGKLAVELKFNAEGAGRMKTLTAAHLPAPERNLRYQIAILWDGQMIGAPVLYSEVGETAIITGNFSQDDVDDMVRILDSGVLPAPLSRVSGPLPEFKQ